MKEKITEEHATMFVPIVIITIIRPVQMQISVGISMVSTTIYSWWIKILGSVDCR
jgi:hypothetical protein